MSRELLRRIGRAYLTGGLSELRRAAARTGAPAAVVPIRGPVGGVLGFDRKPPVPVPVIGPIHKVPPRLKVKALSKTGPAGWLGWLVNHGAACFAAELAYLDFHQSMISPRIKVSWHQADNDCGYVGAHAAVGDRTEYLMTRRFIEPQHPAWGEGFGPNPVHSGGTLGDKSLEIALTRLKEKIGGDPDPGNYRTNPLTVTHDQVEGKNPAERIADYVDKWGRGSDTVAPRRLISSLKLFTAADAVVPELLPLVEYGKGTTESFLRSRANKDHNLKIPAYWDTGASRDQWAQSMVRWFDTVVALVHACECARLHSAAGGDTWGPQWWRVFANCWGIASWSDSSYGDRVLYHELETSHERFRKCARATDIGNVSAERWAAVAKALIRAVGLPGDPGKCGEQIVDTGARRHILDMPPQCGDLRPVTYVEGLLHHYTSVWASRQSFSEGGVIAVQWINSIIGSVASVAGGSAVSSCISAMNTAYASCGVLIRAIGSMANGGSFAEIASEVVNMVGAIISVTSAVAGATGADVDEMIPDGVWEALTTVDAAIPEWGGELADQVAQDAKGLQSYLCDLRDNRRWPYLEEGFSMMIPGSVGSLW